jgi:hypothetical protein
LNNEPGRPTRRAVLAGALGLFVPPAGPFARLVNTLSDPETGPPADNLISNEDSFPRVASALARLAPPGSAYLGVGPDQNLTYIAQAHPRLAVILDHRRRNLLLHLLHKALMTLAPDRATYLSLITARAPLRPVGPTSTAAEIVAAFATAPFDRDRLRKAVAAVEASLKPLGVVSDLEWDDLATIQAKLAGPGLDTRFLALRMYPNFGHLIQVASRDGSPGHFLADEALYRSVRDAQRNDRVVPIVGDFASATALPRLGDTLRGRNVSIGVIYVSDVEFFLLRAGTFAAYAANLARLPWADGAIIVRTSTREIESRERVVGDSSTTITRPASRFLADAIAGRIRTSEDLFR